MAQITVKIDQYQQDYAKQQQMNKIFNKKFIKIKNKKTFNQSDS